MKGIVALILIGCLFASAKAAEKPDYANDPDVKALSKVNLFAFDLVALSGISPGEAYLGRILKRDNRLERLIAVYNQGTPEAKVYALAAFHDLSPEIFEMCRKDCVGKYNPLIHAMAGCVVQDGTLLEYLIRVHRGDYDRYIKHYAVD